LALRLAGGAAEDAREVTQDAWVRAVGRLGAFAWHSSLRTWLSGFVVNCWRERVRALARREHTRAPDPGPGVDPPPVATRVDLERALARLPPGVREVVLLHDVEGYTHAEIGIALGRTPSFSKSQLSRAHARLRDLLADAAPLKEGTTCTPV
jgi:RNA polymerase sigma-70 factor (ECF subfamily)